jgi:hypothetical protein
MKRIGLGSQGWTDLRRRPPKTIYRWKASLIPNWCSAIEDQPLHYRQALLLCEVEEMPYQEICGNIGDPDRERYVAPAPSAEVRSRVTP